MPDTIDLIAAPLKVVTKSNPTLPFLKGGHFGDGLTVRASLTQQGDTVTRTGRIGKRRKQ